MYTIQSYKKFHRDLNKNPNILQSVKNNEIQEDEWLKREQFFKNKNARTS
jgi:hypothetical protein